MAQQLINVGAVANDGTGDTWRAAMVKINANDTELFGQVFESNLIVKVAADFPAPVGGYITLADGVTYVIDGDVTITDGIKPGLRSSIISHSPDGNELNYTGSGVMFTGVNKGLYVGDVSIRCANGTLQDWEDTAPLKGSVINYNNVIFQETKNLGDSKNIKQLRYFSCVFSDIKTAGHTFTGNLQQVFAVDTDFVNNSATPVFDLLAATMDLFWIVDYQVDLVNASGSFISGLTASGNINAGGAGQVLIGLHLGAGTDLIGITNEDNFWTFRNINRIGDTRPDALLYMQGNATPTVITTQSVYVLVTGTQTVGPVSQFTGNAAGRMTYTGQRKIRVPITITLAVEPVSGTNKTISMRIAKNGATVIGSKVLVRADSGSPLSMTCPWQEDMVTGDYIEVFVANDSDTTDVLVSSSISRIN